MPQIIGNEAIRIEMSVMFLDMKNTANVIKVNEYVKSVSLSVCRQYAMRYAAPFINMTISRLRKAVASIT